MKKFDVPQSIAKKIAKLCGTFFIVKSGRPSAADKSLADYVCDGVSAVWLQKELAKRLRLADGSARQVVLIEKALLDEGKIVRPIPHKLLKVLYGELIPFSYQALNRIERALKLR